MKFLKLKETPDDLAVKERLWCATEREIERFAKAYADGHIVGQAYSDAQRDATSAAKSKGYPKGLIREAGRFVKNGEWGGQVCLAFRRGYRARIGL